MKFEELEIKQKLKDKAKDMGFEDLTSIQKKCIPDILEGKDVVGQAETGSGKTVAFGIPIINKISHGSGPQVLVLTPTRELAVQVADVFRDFGRNVGVMTATVYGGVGLGSQVSEMRNCDVIVATPGRMLDHINRKNVDLRRVRFLVLDETDKMFEMGFIEDVEEIISYIPRKRQTLMFSATLSYGIQKIMRKHLWQPVIVKTQSHVDSSKLKQVFYEIREQNEKFSLLVYLLRNKTPGLAIVFCATRKESDIVAKNLKRQDVNAMAIHGGMSQQMRLRSLDALKNQKIDVLVATDVAARGLDIKNVSHVYNYDVPKTPREYTHRIGRTARAGETGDAVTLLTKRDHDNFRRVLADTNLNINKEDMPEFKRIPFSRSFGYDRDKEEYNGPMRGFRRKQSHHKPKPKNRPRTRGRRFATPGRHSHRGSR